MHKFRQKSSLYRFLLKIKWNKAVSFSCSPGNQQTSGIISRPRLDDQTYKENRSGYAVLFISSSLILPLLTQKTQPYPAPIVVHVTGGLPFKFPLRRWAAWGDPAWIAGSGCGAEPRQPRSHQGSPGVKVIPGNGARTKVNKHRPLVTIFCLLDIFPGTCF